MIRFHLAIHLSDFLALLTELYP